MCCSDQSRAAGRSLAGQSNGFMISARDSTPTRRKRNGSPERADKIARFFLGIIKKTPPNMEVRAARVNGQPGLITSVDGQLTDVLTLEVVDGRIAKCFIIRNPDKLARVAIA
jgi:hypothetical protein